ncbi:outer membrane protein Lom [Escherichia coli]|nr:outer membrane protein Lom [Escherichia coli]
MRHLYATILLFTTLLAGIAFPAQAESGHGAFSVGYAQVHPGGVCNQVNHLIPTRVLVKGGEITCKILK